MRVGVSGRSVSRGRIHPKHTDGHSTHPQYRADIDGLRAIAVLSVVGFHAAPGWVTGGFVGVDVFFVISGFLISSIIFKGLDNGRFSFTDFYSRRIRRIFPALIFVLFVSSAFGWFAILADDYKQLMESHSSLLSHGNHVSRRLLYLRCQRSARAFVE